MNKYIYSLLLSLVVICPITTMEPIDGPHNGMAHAAPKGSPDKKRKSSAAPEHPETKVSRTAQQEYAIPAAAQPQPGENYDDFFDELPPLTSIELTQNAQFMEEFEQEMESPYAPDTMPTLTKKHICCNKSFRVDTLKDHIIAIHLKMKPYQCPAPGCEHSAAQSTNLKQHIKRMHADLGDLKPIPFSPEKKAEINKLIEAFKKQNAPQNAKKRSCKCGKSFARLQALKYHIVAAHLKIKPYQCPAPGCTQRCAQDSNLLTHIKKMHAALGDLKPNTLSQEQKDEINNSMEEYIVRPEKQTSTQK